MQFTTGPASDVDHDVAMAWLDHMKGVYQGVIDKHSRSGKMEPGDVVKARNHLKALATIELALRQHHEAANGRTYPGGATRPVCIDFKTIATLILPDGTRKHIHRWQNQSAKALKGL